LLAVGNKSITTNVTNFACPLAYLKNRMLKLHAVFFAVCQWLLLGPHLAALLYVMYSRFSG